MQPVAIGAMTSLLLFGFHLAGKPLLIFMIEKYGQSFPADIQAKFSNPLMRSIMINAGVWLGFGFFFHAAGVAYAALYLSNWWWLAIRGAGVYVMMIICMFGASYTARL